MNTEDMMINHLFLYFKLKHSYGFALSYHNDFA